MKLQRVSAIHCFRSSRTLIKLSILLFMIISYQASSVELPRKVVISYYFPRASTPVDNTLNVFSMSNIIDSKAWPDELRNYWRGMGRIIFRRVDFHSADDYSQDDLNVLFETDINNYDGLAIDELIVARMDSNRLNIFINAISYIRNNYPDKLIIVYSSNVWDANNPSYITAMNALESYVDLIAEEIYFKESQSLSGNWVYPAIMDRLDAIQDCGSANILNKTAIILWIGNRSMDRADVYLPDHIEGQLQYIKEQNLLPQIRGMGFCAPLYASFNDLQHINRIVRDDVLLQLHFKFDETTSTNATDSSGFSNTGILNNFAVPGCWVPGKVENALEFDGVDDYVNCGNDSSLDISEFSYTAWIKPHTVAPQYQHIIGKSTTWTKGFFLGYGRLRGYVTQSVSPATAVYDGIVADTWQHVAMTYANNEVKLYINGQLVPATTTTGSGDIVSDPSYNLQLSSAAYPFDGLMEDVRIYSRALSDIDIAEIYNNAQVQLRYRLDEPSGSSTAADSSAFHSTGTLTNFSTDNCWAGGKSGNALEFDGINDYVDCGNDNSLELNEFTYTAWIKPYDVNSQYQHIIGKNSIWHKGFFLSYGHLRGYVEQSISPATAVYDGITADVWQHVAMTYADNEVKLYINGQLVPATTATGTGNITSTSVYNMRLSNSTYPFNGAIDDVRIYSHALNATEINNIYQQIPDPALQLYLKMDESASTQAPADSSGIDTIIVDLTQTNFTVPGCWVAGRVGNALEFDGVDDYVNCTNKSSFDLKEFTYAVWIKPHTIAPQYQHIIGKSTTWIKGFFLSYGRLRGYVTQSVSPATAVYDGIVADTWQHVAMTYANNEVKLYINGQLVPATTTTGSGDIVSDPSYNLQLSSAAYPFDGLMDEVKIYPRALNEIEINQLYQEY